MSWEDALRRMLPPTDGFQSHTTSPYGAIRDRGTSPHRGVDANYHVGPYEQQGLNLRHPALHSPVDGMVTNAGEGSAGRIAIRDADGASHELLHAHKQYVSIGDQVVAGQMIGTMGNMGVDKRICGGWRLSSSLSIDRCRWAPSRSSGILESTRGARAEPAQLRFGTSAVSPGCGPRPSDPSSRCAGSEENACRKIGSIRL